MVCSAFAVALIFLRFRIYVTRVPIRTKTSEISMPQPQRTIDGALRWWNVRVLSRSKVSDGSSINMSPERITASTLYFVLSFLPTLNDIIAIAIGSTTTDSNAKARASSALSRIQKNASSPSHAKKNIPTAILVLLFMHHLCRLDSALPHFDFSISILLSHIRLEGCSDFSVRNDVVQGLVESNCKSCKIRCTESRRFN